MFINISASGEYRDVISGLNSRMALKFSPSGVVKIFVSIYAINYNYKQENKTRWLAIDVNGQLIRFVVV